MFELRRLGRKSRHDGLITGREGLPPGVGVGDTGELHVSVTFLACGYPLSVWDLILVVLILSR